MTPGLFLLAVAAGGVGAVLRYVVDLGVARMLRTRFPWGIVVVNISGSFALGLVTGALPETVFVVGAGLLGGYTTFSTAMLDALALWKEGERPASLAQVAVTVIGSILAAIGGLAIGGAL